MTRARALIAIASSALLVACASGQPSSEEGLPVGPGEPLELSGTSWTLTQVFVDGELRDAVDSSASLNFEPDGALSGSTGCNRFGGTWTADGPRLALDLGALTLAACMDDDRQAQEAALLADLTGTASYGVRDETLTLVDAQGAALATYQEASADLVGTSWRSTGVNNGQGAVVTTAVTEQLTLRFGDEGSVSGFGGCTDFAGTFTADTPAITIGALAPSTACDPGAPGATQQAEYLAALSAATTYRVDGNRLELRDDSGALQAGFASAG